MKLKEFEIKLGSLDSEGLKIKKKGLLQMAILQHIFVSSITLFPM